MAGTKYIIPLFVFLAACGQPVPEDNYGYGWHYDESGATGARVRYFDDNSPRLAFIEQIFLDTQKCVGASAPGPLVIFVDEMTHVPEHFRAFTHFDTGTVLIEKIIIYDPNAHVGGVLTHEFVHWIMHVNGMPGNSDHASPLFVECERRAMGLD